ncbi:DMT family transporter [Pseudomonas sp. JG-B]|uniref:DMT family transporter n=1 Tax=Pseudomonas sp. JG-B TaxID=2603214 RepID=UPI00129D2781|nr:DMT family transporter [Pseudomonas sp. JG-B]MRK23711.1 DMT family transporter [Pseudomonas sp. JG-B]
MKHGLTTGIAAATFASLTWSMKFIAPLFIGEYSIFDLAACRFIISGLIGAVILMANFESCRNLGWKDWLAAAGLGFIGYVGYFMAVAIAATYAGPVIAPAFLGLVPVALAISGNVQGGISWRLLQIPFSLAALGLVLVNVQNVAQPEGLPYASLALGVGASMAAVALWVWFGLANQRALLKRPGMNAWLWTAMMMVGGSLQTLVFLPVGAGMELFNAPMLGFGLSAIGHLYLPALMLAAVASIGGAWAWTIASQRLPITLASQLLSMEMVFATCLGLLFSHRWPTAPEVLGISLIVLGVVKAIGAFRGNPGSPAVAH